MKLFRLIGLLVLVVSIGACGDSSDGNGGDGGGGAGGDGGSGGTGGNGPTEDRCLGDSDTAAYNLYGDGDYEAGILFASTTAGDCLDDGPEPSCYDEVIAVLNAGGEDEELNEALADCVVDCTKEVLDPPLSDNCLTCYGESVLCGSRDCAGPCFEDVCAEACVQCRTDAGCFSDFDACSGLPDVDMCSGN